MTRFAPVAPPQLLRSMHQVGNFLVGRYHLLLAHDVVAQPKAYKNLLPDASFVVMDNSMVELGHPVSWDFMQEAINTVKSNVLVLPDVYGDAEATVELSAEAAHKWNLREVDGEPQWFMAVPQGRTLQEYEACAAALAKLPRVKFWGCARTVTKDFGSRKEAVAILVKNPPRAHRFGPLIHLLGFSDNLLDDIGCARLPHILGIDSAVPVRMGQRGKLMYLEQTDHEPRGDFWEQDHSIVLAETIANMALMRGWILPNYGNFSPTHTNSK